MRDMSADNRNRSVSDSELIAAVKSHDDPAVKVSELEESLGLTGTRINQLLNDLEEQGVVASKRFGSGRGWWVPDRAPEPD